MAERIVRLMPTKFPGLFFTLSLFLALVNLLLPFRAPLFIVYPLTALWLLLLAFALLIYGKRGLWLLLGSPIALFWAIMLVLYSFHYVDFP